MIRQPKPIKRSPVKRSGKPIPRSNPARKRREFARAYHSKERVEFVKGLACVGCQFVGQSENAHIRTGGAGRKADYTAIVPLCGNDGLLRGCHALLHDWGRTEFEENFVVNLDEAAANTEKLWLEHSNAV